MESLPESRGIKRSTTEPVTVMADVSAVDACVLVRFPLGAWCLLLCGSLFGNLESLFGKLPACKTNPTESVPASVCCASPVLKRGRYQRQNTTATAGCLGLGSPTSRESMFCILFNSHHHQNWPTDPPRPNRKAKYVSNGLGAHKLFLV